MQKGQWIYVKLDDDHSLHICQVDDGGKQFVALIRRLSGVYPITDGHGGRTRFFETAGDALDDGLLLWSNRPAEVSSKS